VLGISLDEVHGEVLAPGARLLEKVGRNVECDIENAHARREFEPVDELF